ncbi:MAG: hypothetical protein Q9227_001239 [Pyrenula ochraceoflavens]
MAKSYDNNTINAVTFEKSNRAHGDVRDLPFYKAPKGSAGAEPGTLLKLEEETDTNLYTIPPSLAMSRFIYQSKKSTGSYVPVSAYVLWPYTAAPSFHGGLPLVAWAHGTSGTSAQCAPSNIRNLWHHFQVQYQLALAGYVVVATDYAGLGVEHDANGKFVVHEYLNSVAQGTDVIYSIVAAQKAFSPLSKEFVLIGSSQGGGAVWNAAQQLVINPFTGYLGTVTLSPATSVLDLPPDEPVMGWLVINMIPSIKARFPNFEPSDILETKGLEALETYRSLQGGSTVLFQLHTDLDILKPHWRENNYVRQWQSLAANGGKPIAGPLLVVQGETDPIIHVETTTAAVRDTANKFPETSIEYVILSGVTHGPVMHAGQRLYLDWIAARFSRQPAVSGFKSGTLKPVRPASALQPETNFFLALQTEPWQAT